MCQKRKIWINSKIILLKCIFFIKNFDTKYFTKQIIRKSTLKTLLKLGRSINKRHLKKYIIIIVLIKIIFKINLIDKNNFKLKNKISSKLLTFFRF